MAAIGHRTRPHSGARQCVCPGIPKPARRPPLGRVARVNRDVGRTTRCHRVQSGIARIMCGGPLAAPATVDVRFWPRLCENVCDFDANGTAHHFGSVSVGANCLMPTFAWLGSKCRSHSPPTFLDLSFYTASANSRHDWRESSRFFPEAPKVSWQN